MRESHVVVVREFAMFSQTALSLVPPNAKTMCGACFDALGRKNPCTNSRETILCEWGASSGVAEGVENAPTKMRQKNAPKKLLAQPNRLLLLVSY
jgi:hypothetical protein